MLNYPKAEFVLVGAAQDVVDNLGSAGEEMEKRAEEEKNDAVDDIKDAADIKVCGACSFIDSTKGKGGGQL